MIACHCYRSISLFLSLSFLSLSLILIILKTLYPLIPTTITPCFLIALPSFCCYIKQTSLNITTCHTHLNHDSSSPSFLSTKPFFYFYYYHHPFVILRIFNWLMSYMLLLAVTICLYIYTALLLVTKG